MAFHTVSGSGNDATKGRWRITSTNDPAKDYHSPTKATSDRLSGFSLTLKTVLGTTTLSPTCFDCIPDASSFVTCAGSVAVLSHADENFDLTHKFFRSSPVTSAAHTSSQYENSMTVNRLETHSRQVVTVRNSVHGAKVARASVTVNNSPKGTNRGDLLQRTKAITCVSLSPDGKCLAVGEV